MFYNKESDAVLQELGASRDGLTSEEAKARLAKYGPNQLEGKKEDSALVIFLKQFTDLLVIILIIAAIISGISGQLESTFVILAVITLNAILGTVQTIKAQKSLDSLKQLSAPKSKVYRDGQLVEVDASQLTVGDIVYVEAGDIIGGDGRLLEIANLQVNESALTGETLAVDKTLAPITDEVLIADQTNMVFSGSLVTNGTGRYVVTSIGMGTEMGKIATYLNEAKEKKTPLQKSLDQFSVYLTIGIVLICLVVLALNIFLAHENLLDALMVAVALAVAAIPEALSSIVTIVLSLSTQKMVKENAIIKNLNSVESLGCVSIICSDKTGTLTQNKMTAVDVYINNAHVKPEALDLHHHDVDALLKGCVICNNAVVDGDRRIGDPTEMALLDLAQLHQFDLKSTRREEIPFDSDRKLMSVASDNHLYTKGAFDELILRCDEIVLDSKKVPLTKEHINHLKKINQEQAENGLRVLGFAYKKFNETKELSEDHLTFVGLISLMDPPRPESKEAVAQCRIGGIKPIMITGDHVVTAQAIAKDIGIYQEGDICLEGRALANMSEEELDEKLPQISVYARVAPEHKIRIVKAWQKRGNIVAMTGDGVNDAPALKQSDIGVAMGITGTEVSKDAASMILTDDNFATIVKAVITGRNVYNNIKNAILYLLSGNFAGILCVLFCSLLILPTPLLAVHLLFINLITDSLPAIAIGMEQSNDSILHQKPRDPKEGLLNKNTISKIGFEGIVIAIMTMVAYFAGLEMSEGMASTMAFATICLARLLHGFNCRSHLPISKLGLTTNKASIMAFFAGFILLHLVLFVPICQRLFSITALDMTHLMIIYGCALVPTIIIQIAKMLTYKKEA